jgi:xanthine dehydrogenase accessory factor
MSLFAHAADLENSSLNAALCTVVEVNGSTPRKAGAKMIVIDTLEPSGEIVGTIGGGAIEHLIRNEAIKSIRSSKSQLVKTSLKNELGMCCGGIMTVFIEPIIKSPILICFGAGHISQALCPLAVRLGYRVTVVDSRKELLMKDAFIATVHHVIEFSHFSLLDMPFSNNTYVVITTHDHDLDQKIVEGILRHTFKYGALVGSLRKALMTKKRLLSKGFNQEDVKRIICPAGLNINASTLVKNEAQKDRSNDSRSGQQYTHGHP